MKKALIIVTLVILLGIAVFVANIFLSSRVDTNEQDIENILSFIDSGKNADDIFQEYTPDLNNYQSDLDYNISQVNDTQTEEHYDIGTRDNNIDNNYDNTDTISDEISDDRNFDYENPENLEVTDNIDNNDETIPNDDETIPNGDETIPNGDETQEEVQQAVKKEYKRQRINNPTDTIPIISDNEIISKTINNTVINLGIAENNEDFNLGLILNPKILNSQRYIVLINAECGRLITSNVYGYNELDYLNSGKCYYLNDSEDEVALVPTEFRNFDDYGICWAPVNERQKSSKISIQFINYTNYHTEYTIQFTVFRDAANKYRIGTIEDLDKYTEDYYLDLYKMINRSLKLKPILTHNIGDIKLTEIPNLDLYKIDNKDGVVYRNQLLNSELPAQKFIVNIEDRCITINIYLSRDFSDILGYKIINKYNNEEELLKRYDIAKYYVDKAESHGYSEDGTKVTSGNLVIGEFDYIAEDF